VNPWKSKSNLGRKSRSRVELGMDLEKSLSAYVCAAVAAGVGLLGASNFAEAEVVYTPAHTVLPVGEMVQLDLNHDGVADFAFLNFRFFSTSSSRSSHRTALDLYAGCATVGATCLYPQNQIWGRGGVYQRFGSALRSGFRVGANRSYFQQAPRNSRGFVPNPVALMGALGMGYTYQGYLAGSGTSGQWMYTRDRYLGLQFMIDGQIHYGWARVAVGVDRLNRQSKIEAILTGYAYETVPGKPILTGATASSPVSASQPASLSHLAQGASSIAAWRKTN
jgi:hypothetical protein